MISQAQKYAEEGLRVLVLAHSPEKSEGTELPKIWNRWHFCF